MVNCLSAELNRMKDVESKGKWLQSLKLATLTDPPSSLATGTRELSKSYREWISVKRLPRLQQWHPSLNCVSLRSVLRLRKPGRPSRCRACRYRSCRTARLSWH